MAVVVFWYFITYLRLIFSFWTVKAPFSVKSWEAQLLYSRISNAWIFVNIARASEEKVHSERNALIVAGI